MTEVDAISISKFASILTFGSVLGFEQSGVFKLQNVIGQLVKSELVKTSFVGETTNTEASYAIYFKGITETIDN